MRNGVEAIRKLVDPWLAANKKDDIATMLDLLAEDVIFMVPGKEPFGKKEFEIARQEMIDVKMREKAISRRSKSWVIGAGCAISSESPSRPSREAQQFIPATSLPSCVGTRTGTG